MILTSLPRKILIIPDVHFRIETVNKILDREKDTELVVFLGDYFDEFQEKEKDIVQTIEFLKNHIFDPRFVFLLGNHDTSYFYPNNKFCQCSGYTHFKRALIRDILKPTTNVLDRFHFFLYFRDNNKLKWLLSHAGYSPYWNMGTSKIRIHLTEQEIKAKKQLSRNNNHWFVEAGLARGGGSVVGGLTWLDWDWEFKEVPGLHQIVGHTPHSKPQYKFINGDKNGDGKRVAAGSFNVNLDTHLKHYAVFHDGAQLEVVDVEPLNP